MIVVTAVLWALLTLGGITPFDTAGGPSGAAAVQMDTAGGPSGGR